MPVYLRNFSTYLYIVDIITYRLVVHFKAFVQFTTYHHFDVSNWIRISIIRIAQSKRF